MDLFDKLKGSLDRTVNTVSARSKSFLETSRIRGELSHHEQARAAALEELGSIVYTSVRREHDLDMDRIRSKSDEVLRLDGLIEFCNAELRRIEQEAATAIGEKTIHGHCKSCRKPYDAQTKFCSFCGSAIAESLATT